MLQLTDQIGIPEDEIGFEPIRAQGAGGQNVNKVASAIHLRFDIVRSSLPEDYQQRLLAFPDQRISKDGVIVIKAQRFRNQEQNRADAQERLAELIRAATTVRKQRKPTRPTLAARHKRLESKIKRGRLKKLRGTVD